MAELQFKRTIFKIDLYGQSYEMRKPTVVEAVNFQKNLTGTESDQLSRLTDFFVSLGLPKEAIDQMEVEHLVTLAAEISASSKKK